MTVASIAVSPQGHRGLSLHATMGPLEEAGQSFIPGEGGIEHQHTVFRGVGQDQLGANLDDGGDFFGPRVGLVEIPQTVSKNSGGHAAKINASYCACTHNYNRQ